MIHEFPYGLDVALADGILHPVWNSSDDIVTNPTLQSAVRASRVLTASGSISDGETVTIQRRDGTNAVYTFKTALTPTVGQVLIGASIDTAITNLGAAITGGGTPGTDYAAGTEPCLDYEVAIDTGADTVTLTAINYGDAYNTAVGNFAEGGANLAWGSATSGVDTPDFTEALDYAAAATASAAPVFRNRAPVICPTAPQLTCKSLHVNLYDSSAPTSGDFKERPALIVTTDHPAAKLPNGCLYAGVLDDPTDLASNGTTVEIPNESHGSWGDWLGGPYSVPDADDIIKGAWAELWNPYTGARAIAEIKAYDFDGGTGNQGLVTFVIGAGVRNFAALRAGSTIYYRIYDSNPGIAPELGTQAQTDVTTRLNAYDAPTKAEMDAAFAALNNISGATVIAALKTAMGVVTGAVAVDAGNTSGQFTATVSAGSTMRFGYLVFTSDNLATEGRPVRWGGNVVVVVKPDSVPAGLEEIAAFSAEPDEGATFEFWPLG